MKKSTILTAQTLGYFRAKNEEKRTAILDELLELEEFSNVSRETVTEVLQAETLRRHVVYQNRAQKAFDKIEANAAKPLSSGVDTAHGHVQDFEPGNYILTVAQNNTDVDPVFLGALENFAKHNDAKILCAKMTYNKNGFAIAQDATDGIYYDPAIVKYLVEGQISLGGKIHFIGQANVSPTAKNPLSSFEAITPVGVSVIIPASKIALKCTAALKGGQGKILFGTGCITKRNYILRKAGAVAASTHNIGALYVSVAANGSFVARQLELMEGSNGFYDENRFYHYDNDKSTDMLQAATAIQFGDIHAEKLPESGLTRLIAQIEKYAPENVILHDVMDFSSRNHHNVKDCAFMFTQHIKQNTVRRDIITVSNIIQAIAEAGSHEKLAVHIVESNHDLAINTWLKNEDFKEDPINATLYLQCMLALYQHIENESPSSFNMLKYATTKIGGLDDDNVIFHDTDESVIIAGIEMGNHGHTGANGSRGSPAQFAALGVKMNTGHTHTPSIVGGCYTAGCCELEMGYNVGPSSWRLANILTWPNGQRQVIFMN